MKREHTFNRFPAELATLLSNRGRRELATLERSAARRRRAELQCFSTLNGWISLAMSMRCIELLDRHMAKHLRAEAQPIPSSSITSMRKNYGELLPKTMRVASTILDRPRSDAMRSARAIGLVEFLNSPSLHRLAESAAGRRLDQHPGMQLLLYKPGDYTGPHNDHHPEWSETRDGFVDVHLSFASGDVADQYLVYERAGHFSEVAPLALPAVISVYRLPFWHFTTPLVAKTDRHRQARRWVLLASYTLAR